MKKKLLILIIAILLLPVIVHADPGSYEYDTHFEAYVNAREGLVIESDDCEYDEDEEPINCKPEKIIPYKAVVKVLSIEEWDEGEKEYTIQYEGELYYVDGEFLTGTKVDYKEYQTEENKVSRTLNVLKDIYLYDGPDDVFPMNNVTLKEGDKVKVTYSVEPGYIYIESKRGNGWIYEEDLYDVYTDSFSAYYDEKGTVRLYDKNDFSAYTYDGKKYTYSKELQDYTSFNYIGTMGLYYVYKDNDNLIFMYFTQFGRKNDNYSPEYSDYIYISDNTDVDIFEFNYPEKEVDSTKLFNNGDVLYYAEHYNDNYYVVINNIGYVIRLNYETKVTEDEMTIKQLNKHLGAILMDGVPTTLKLKKDVYYYIKPMVSSRQLGKIKKGEYVENIGGYYNDVTKRYFMYALGYGWVPVDEDMFQIKDKKEYYDYLDIGDYYDKNCEAYYKGELKDGDELLYYDEDEEYVEDDDDEELVVDDEDEEYYDEEDYDENTFDANVCYNPDIINKVDKISNYSTYLELVLSDVTNPKLIKIYNQLYNSDYYWHSQKSNVYKSYNAKIAKIFKDHQNYVIPGDIKPEGESIIETAIQKENAKTTTTTTTEATTKKAVARKVDDGQEKMKLPLIIALCLAGVVGCIIALLIVGNNRKKKLQAEQPNEQNIESEVQPEVQPIVTETLSVPTQEELNVIDTKTDIYEQPVEEPTEQQANTTNEVGEENKNE